MWRPVLMLALLVTLATGCGGSKSSEPNTDTAEPAKKTIPVDEYVSRADDICLAVAKRSLAIRDRIQQAHSADEAADQLEQQLENVRDFRTRIAALGVPEGHEATAKALVAQIRAAEPYLERVIEATRSHDQEAASEAARGYQESSLKSARYARSSGLGFKVCGSGA